MRTLLASLVLWILAAVVRLREVDQVIVSSDSLGPYLRAWSLGWDWIPKPPNPESGDGLWLLAWPLVHAASSLVELMQIRLVLGGIVAPAAFMAVWGFLSPEVSSIRRWIAATSAGVWVAMDPGLVDTLISGARSYGAPELVGLATATAAWALRGRLWAGVATVILLALATDHHPLAAGMIVSVLWWFPAFREALGRRGLSVAAVTGFILSLPRLLRTGAQAMCGEGPIACLSQVAQSNVGDQVDRGAVLWAAMHDRLAVDLGWLWVPMALGIVLCLSQVPTRKAATWALGGLLGLLILGATIGYIRPYHLRILAVPMAVAAVIGLSQLWPLCLGVACAAGFWGWTERPVGPDPGALARADQIAATVITVDGPLWVDQVWWDGPPRVDAPAVVLSAVLQGTDPDRFTLSETATMILLTSAGPPAPWPPIMEGPGWRVHPAPSAAAARDWVDGRANRPHSVGGALDWAGALHPRSASASRAQWW